MHVVVSTKGNRRWISGIFVDARDARSSLTSLPPDEAVQHAIEHIAPAQFPFFILEDNTGFRFLEAAEATHIIQSMPQPTDPKSEPILFAIVSEYRPDVAGRDEMGTIRHVHLDQEHIVELRRHGLCSLTDLG